MPLDAFRQRSKCPLAEIIEFHAGVDCRLRLRSTANADFCSGLLGSRRAAKRGLSAAVNRVRVFRGRRECPSFGCIWRPRSRFPPRSRRRTEATVARRSRLDRPADLGRPVVDSDRNDRRMIDAPCDAATAGSGLRRAAPRIACVGDERRERAPRIARRRDRGEHAPRAGFSGERGIGCLLGRTAPFVRVQSRAGGGTDQGATGTTRTTRRVRRLPVLPDPWCDDHGLEKIGGVSRWILAQVQRDHDAVCEEALTARDRAVRTSSLGAERSSVRHFASAERIVH